MSKPEAKTWQVFFFCKVLSKNSSFQITPTFLQHLYLYVSELLCRIIIITAVKTLMISARLADVPQRLCLATQDVM